MSIEILTQATLNSKDIISKSQIPEIIAAKTTYYCDALRSVNMTTRTGIANSNLFYPFIPRYTINTSSLGFFVSTALASQNYRIMLLNSGNDGFPDGQLFNTANISGASPTGLRSITEVYYKNEGVPIPISNFKFIQNKKYWINFYTELVGGAVRAFTTPATHLIELSNSTDPINSYRITTPFNNTIDKITDLPLGSLSKSSGVLPALYWLT